MRVLHIEDDQSTARAIERMLRINYGAEVMNVDTADLAIGALTAANLGTKFDLVISDWDLKEGDGGEVIDWATRCVPTMLSRWVLLSGNEMALRTGGNRGALMVDYGIVTGVTDDAISITKKEIAIPFLVKPADSTMLRQAIDHVLGRCKVPA